MTGECHCMPGYSHSDYIDDCAGMLWKTVGFNRKGARKMKGRLEKINHHLHQLKNWTLTNQEPEIQILLQSCFVLIEIWALLLLRLLWPNPKNHWFICWPFFLITSKNNYHTCATIFCSRIISRTPQKHANFCFLCHFWAKVSSKKKWKKQI